MFIKKDLRKIGEMLESSTEATPLTHLKLGRRPAEFKPVANQKSSRGVKGGPSSGGGGSLNVLFGTRSNLEKMKWLKYLSVYDSEIESIEGIGRLECGEVEEINGTWFSGFTNGEGRKLVTVLSTVKTRLQKSLRFILLIFPIKRFP